MKGLHYDTHIHVEVVEETVITYSKFHLQEGNTYKQDENSKYLLCP